MHVVDVILFAGVCIGHIAILAFSNNWWFALALPHRMLGVLRILHGLFVIGGLAAFGLGYPLDLSLQRALSSGDALKIAATSYAIFCSLVGLIWLPLITVVRLLRPQAAVLLSNHTKTVDVARDIGHKPTGQGKYWFLARLPGNQIFQVDFTEKTLCLPQLPAAWDGLSILHVSDLHLCGTPDKIFYQQVMDACKDWNTDIVAFTGDTVDTDEHYRWLLPVLGKLHWQVAAFAILGNHDSWHEPALLRRRLRRCGYHVLGNSWEQIEVRGVPLVVIGHEGPWFKPEPDVTTCPEEAFRLCLSHTPDNIGWARKHQIDLMLAGHNHGGQIRFPLIGSVLVPSYYGRRYDFGTFYEPPTVLHVSRGLAGQHPLRYNCRPEITKLVLKRQA